MDAAAQPARTNWAGNLRYNAARVLAPGTIAEAQEIVPGADKLRVLGSRHCFNDIADTTGVHLSLERLNRVLALDETGRTVTVEGGIRYGELGAYLHERGYALHNLASLPHISVAGAVATATHGSGARLGNLATAVTALTFIDARGDLVSLSRERDGDAFAGAVVNLGTLGPVVSLTLAVEPTFAVRQRVYRDLPFEAAEAHFTDVMSAGYSVSLFTRWQSDTIEQVWVKSRDGEPALPDDLYGAHPSPVKLHPLPDHDPVNCTEQLDRPGPWHQRLPHFRLEFTPSSGAELQAEYFVAREDAVAALGILHRWGRALGPFLLVSEVRTIAADDLWLSPAYRRDLVAFHFTLRQDVPGVLRILYELEQQLAPLAPVPHWGKIFAMSAAKVQAAYPRLADFRDLATQHDPHGRFRNKFVDKYVFGR
jgi:xylitol oxidase